MRCSESSGSNPYRTIYSSMREIVRVDGLIGLQKGLSSALAFQFVLNFGRLGLYQHIDNQGLTRNADGSVSTLRCVFWGATSGVFGSTMACPFYMIKTQLQSKTAGSGQSAAGFQHEHTSTTNALRNIYRKHGVLGLWKGYFGIIPRTSIGSAVQLSTFTKCKETFTQFEVFQRSYFLTAFASSLITGYFTCVAMTPFDCIATRLFNQGEYCWFSS
jgi:solute carrier family 25, member 34/35